MHHKIYPALFYALFLILWQVFLYGQNPPSPCGDSLQEYSYAYNLPKLTSRFKVANNGDLMAGGWGNSAADRAVIMKWNAQEKLEWIKKESSSDWNLWDVAPLSDGNWVYLKKHRDSTNWVELIKINPQGELLWNRRYRLQSTFTFENQLISLEKTEGFLLNSFHSLTQFDGAGNLVWSRTLPDGVFLGGAQRSDGRVLVLTQEVSAQATLLLLNDKGNIIKQNALNGIALDAALGAVYALTNNGCMLRINDQSIARLIKIDANLIPAWGKEIPNYGINSDAIISKNDDVFFPFYEVNKIDALAFDQQGNYLWSLKLQGFRPGSGVTYGAPYLDGWKFFVPDLNFEAPAKSFLLKFPNTQLPEEGCFFTLGSAPSVKDIKLSISPGKVVLNNFLLKEIPSAAIRYETIPSMRQIECRIANPCPEICDNDIDDNGDGLIDCADPACETVPKLDLGPDQLVCNNSITLFRTTADFTRYRWSDGTTDSTLTAFSPGLYWVDTWNVCGNLQSDSIRLNVQPLKEVELEADRNLCAGDTLHVSIPSFTQLKWSPAQGLNCDTCQSIILKPDRTTRYYVTARFGNCSSVDSILITLEDCKPFSVYVPNVMSLSSTVNTQLHPFFSSRTELLAYQFEIYDRWGELVFRSQDTQQSWNGTKNGQWGNQGVYVWTLRVRYRENGQEKGAFKAGEVLLIH